LSWSLLDARIFSTCDEQVLQILQLLQLESIFSPSLSNSLNTSKFEVKENNSHITWSLLICGNSLIIPSNASSSRLFSVIALNLAGPKQDQSLYNCLCCAKCVYGDRRIRSIIRLATFTRKSAWESEEFPSSTINSSAIFFLLLPLNWQCCFQTINFQRFILIHIHLWNLVIAYIYKFQSLAVKVIKCSCLFFELCRS